MYFTVIKRQNKRFLGEHFTMSCSLGLGWWIFLSCACADESLLTIAYGDESFLTSAYVDESFLTSAYADESFLASAYANESFLASAYVDESFLMSAYAQFVKSDAYVTQSAEYGTFLTFSVRTISNFPLYFH